MKINKKLELLLQELGRGAQRRLAEYLGENPVNVNRWVKGTRPIPQEKLKKVANFFGVTVDYLLDESKDTPTIRYIPMIGKASCGVPTNYHYEDVEWIPVPAYLGREGVYAIVAEGDSMLPKIHNGDEVICDKNAQVNNGDIVHYTIDDEESGIKKIKFSSDGEKITLMPLNLDCENYEPIIVDLNKHTVRFSKCIKVMANL